MSSHETKTIEHLAPGVTREWRFDRRLVIYTLSQDDRYNIHTYIKSNIDMLLQWPRYQPVLVMHTLSGPEVSVTPYFRRRMSEIVDVIRHNRLSGRGAIVVQDNFFQRLMSLLGKRLLNETGTFQHCFFTQRDAARQWLEAALSHRDRPVNDHASVTDHLSTS